MEGSPVVALARAGGIGGGKAAGLRWLLNHGYAVPPTWVVHDVGSDPMALWAALNAVVKPDRTYAVRSSANVEDGGEVSYAGQFESELDVYGVEGVLAAVDRVHASASGDGVVAYREFVGDQRPIEMAVLVQEMVRPVWSGVAFSRNPVTGLNETVVEAIAGDGEALMSGRVAPDRWVRRWGDVIEQPEAAVVDGGVVEQVAEGVERIAAAYGRPVDLEWVHDGERLWWVQVRAISGLDGITIYSRRISKEVMPGIIKPLVWSINVPMVNQAWITLFREALGDVDIAPGDLAKAFGYRSYFNMTALGLLFEAMGMPRDSLELLLGLPAGSKQPRFKPTVGTMRKLPRLTVMVSRKLRYHHEVERQLPSLQVEYQRFAERDVAASSDQELLADIGALRRIGERAAMVNIVTPLLANIYTALLRSRLHKRGVDLASVDLLEDMPAVEELDPNLHLDGLAARIHGLDRTTRQAVLQDGYAALPPDVATEVDEFLRRFGHFSDSGNDFSIATWREQPDTVVKLAATRIERHRSDGRLGWEEVRRKAPLWQRPVLDALWRRARLFIKNREAVSSTYTFGYGLFRRYFLEIGRRLAERDLITAADDVMYLTFDEVRSALTGDDAIDAVHVVAKRKAEIDRVRDLELPDVIYGDDFVPSPGDDIATTSWHGTPTARGHHRGPVRVVAGIADFAKVEEGDVLAIPYSDVGWTPLFAKAGAVVAESGGLLSHSSIVAREYGIPCVVSVAGAMRIPEGAMVTVDGYRGIIVLEEDG